MPRTPVPADSDLAVTYVPLEDLHKWPSNPKEHDLGAIAASVIRFGMRDPIGANANNHFIEEGHGRLDVLDALKRQHRPAPRFVRVDDDGRWLVPVLLFDDDEVTQRGYMLAHNRTQDLGGGYDDAKLLAELEDQARYGMLPGTGYDGDDVDALRRRLMEETGAGDQTGLLRSSYQVLVTCINEEAQLALIERLVGEGLEVRALVS